MHIQAYLRTKRKGTALSQEEVAMLLGGSCPTPVSRHEHGERLPSLATAFAYQVIFGAPLHELFAGIYEQSRQETLRHVYDLMAQLTTPNPDAVTRRKLEHLDRILEDQIPSLL